VCVLFLFSSPNGLSGPNQSAYFRISAQPGDRRVLLGALYGESGFELACVNGSFGFATFQTNSPYYSGSTALFNDSSDDYTSLARSDGGYFDFISIDLSNCNIQILAASSSSGIAAPIRSSRHRFTS